jgi:uncharacterized repeat protein (TIGR03803 family)
MKTRNWLKTACVVCLLSAAAIAAPAQTFNPVFKFDGTNGEDPRGLVQATDGNLYGTTEHGGAIGYGTLFRISTGRKLTTFYTFCSQALCSDGSYPVGALIQAADGKLYGVTNGGAGGRGAVFKVTLSGTLTTLYSFCSSGYPVCPDGYWPFAGLVQGIDGNFYGTTIAGGPLNYGTVFKVTQGGKLTNLHSFVNTDGSDPVAGLIQANDGNFYGVAQYGGTHGAGTVFRITPSGAFTTLYNFGSQPSCGDGQFPQAALVEASDGNLYGTTNGQAGCGYGTLFKITPTGTFTELHNFCSEAGCADGVYPATQLVQGSDGNLYGVTTGGVYPTLGTVFKFESGGTLTTLYNFCLQEIGCPNGAYPGGLMQDTSGTFYGTTHEGGLRDGCVGGGCGTLFSLATGLGPFVETVPTSGKAARLISILGTNLTGASAVTFNGAPAAFTVESPTAIKVTVPAGATTGPVQVVTPSGTLSSNVNFRVLP